MALLSGRISFLCFLGTGGFVTAAALSGGCSILFHADAIQCSTDSDCRVRGDLFANTRCSAGTCIPVATSTVTSSSTSTSSSTGSSGPPPCQTNNDCLQPGMTPCNSNIACNVDTGQCLNLTTISTNPTSAECDFVIGNYCGANGTPAAPPPVFIGAFAQFPTTGNPLTDPSYLNYELAIDDFATYATGVPIGRNGPRTPVAVVCNVNGNITDAMTHLIGDLGVPVIVTPLEPLSNLATTFTTWGLPSTTTNPLGPDAGLPYPGALFINPFGADSTLTTSKTFTTKGFLWHMLGQPSDLAPAYAAFLPLIERYVRNNPNNNQFWNSVGSTGPLKIATVLGGSNQLLVDLDSAVTPILTWNGGETVAQNMGDGGGAPTLPNDGGPYFCPCQTGSNYCAVTLPQSYLDTAPNLAPNSGVTGGYADTANCLQSFGPQVIISFASNEFIQLMDYMDTPAFAPFYLVSPYNDQDPYLSGFITASPILAPKKASRVAGIDFASAADPTVLDAYNQHFLNGPLSEATQSDLGEENYYDAMFFAIYSLVAAGPQSQPTPQQAVNAMANLISSPLVSPSVDVGPIPAMTTAIADLSNGAVSLVGTLGPPNFNQATGSRISQGDVYCVDYIPPDAGGGTTFDTDVLRLANPDGGPAEDGGGALTGTFPCYPGIQQ